MICLNNCSVTEPSDICAKFTFVKKLTKIVEKWYWWHTNLVVCFKITRKTVRCLKLLALYLHWHIDHKYERKTNFYFLALRLLGFATLQLSLSYMQLNYLNIIEAIIDITENYYYIFNDIYNKFLKIYEVKILINWINRNMLNISRCKTKNYHIYDLKVPQKLKLL